MNEERLNNILLLQVHKEETDTLNLTEIARLFVSANTRRENFWGKFAYFFSFPYMTLYF